MLPILLLYETKCRKSLAVKEKKGVLWFYVIWNFWEVEGKIYFYWYLCATLKGRERVDKILKATSLLDLFERGTNDINMLAAFLEAQQNSLSVLVFSDG